MSGYSNMQDISMRIRLFLCTFVIITLVACTQTAQRDVIAPTRLPSATAIPTDPTATALAVKLAQPTPQSPTAVTNLDTLAGMSPEGYAMLGAANAPVTFVDYSDFF
jgi:hypothetical protein